MNSKSGYKLFSIVSLIVLFFCPVLFIHCISMPETVYWNIPLAEEDIDFIELNVRRSTTVLDSESVLEPGHIYIITAEIYTNDGFILEQPNHRDLVIDAPTGFFSSIESFNEYIKIETSASSFPAIINEGYEFTITVKSNPFTGQTFFYPVDTGHVRTLDFSGKDGRFGTHGYMNSEDEAIDGENGRDGQPGLSRRMAAFPYLYNAPGGANENMLCLIDLDTGNIYLFPLRSITIDLSGGDGGDGGHGVNSKYNGSSGGLGGNGAPGGDLTLYCLDSRITGLIRFKSDGGKRGENGSSGQQAFSRINPLLFPLDIAAAIAEEELSGEETDEGHGLISQDGEITVLEVGRKELLSLLPELHPAFDVDLIESDFNSFK